MSTPAARAPCCQSRCESRHQGEEQAQLHRVELFTVHAQTADSPGRCHRRPLQWVARALLWATTQEIPFKPTYGHKQTQCCLQTQCPQLLSGVTLPVTAQLLLGSGCLLQSSLPGVRDRGGLWGAVCRDPAGMPAPPFLSAPAAA